MYERRWYLTHFEMHFLENLVWTGLILSMFLPLTLFRLPHSRRHRSQKSQRTFLIESNDHESFLYIKWNTLARLPRDKVIKPNREGPRNSCCPCNLEIKNQEDKLVVQCFLSKHISPWTTRAYIQRQKMDCISDSLRFKFFQLRLFVLLNKLYATLSCCLGYNGI